MSKFGPDHVLRLLSHDVDIVTAFCTTRKLPIEPIGFNHVKDNFKENLEEGRLIEAPCGMAFTLIKREVFDETAELIEGTDEYVWFTLDRQPRVSFNDEVEDFVRKNRDRTDIETLILEAITLGQCSYFGSQLVGEDYNFCKRAHTKGFKSFIDCGCVIGHIGSRSYDVNDFIQHLQRNAEPRIIRP